MFISFFTGKVMLFYGISLIMKEKSNASALIRRLFNHALEFLGLKNHELSDRELAYILWCIYQDLQSNHLLCKKS